MERQPVRSAHRSDVFEERRRRRRRLAVASHRMREMARASGVGGRFVAAALGVGPTRRLPIRRRSKYSSAASTNIPRRPRRRRRRRRPPSTNDPEKAIRQDASPCRGTQRTKPKTAQRKNDVRTRRIERSEQALTGDRKEKNSANHWFCCSVGPLTGDR